MRSPSEHGFTLLEVVLSVAILALGAMAIFPIFATSPGRLEVAADRAMAAEELKAKMENQLLTKEWATLPQNGEFGGWSWQIEGTDYAHESDSATQSEFLYQLTGTISHAEVRYGPDIVFDRIIVRTK